jgi:tetratricopeptide (TPR) repeat protein
LKFRHALWLAVIVAAFVWGAVGAQAGTLPEIQQIEDEWAEVFYKLPSRQQVAPFKALLERVRIVKADHPEHAEPLIMEAIVLCALAASDWGFSSLSRLREARDLLVKSIDFDPNAMEATAFITLGNLYYRLPGWPISFGDNDLAVQYLEAAAKLYPDALDVNFFLGDYWLHEGEHEKALVYLSKAEKAPIRSSQRLSDEKLKEQLQAALEAARKRAESHADFFSSLLPDMGGQSQTSP